MPDYTRVQSIINSKNSRETLKKLNEPPSESIDGKRFLSAKAVRLLADTYRVGEEFYTQLECHAHSRYNRFSLKRSAFMVKFLSRTGKPLHQCMMKLGDYINDDPILGLCSFETEQPVTYLDICDPFTGDSHNDHVTLVIIYDVAWKIRQ